MNVLSSTRSTGYAQLTTKEYRPSLFELTFAERGEAQGTLESAPHRDAAVAEST